MEWKPSWWARVFGGADAWILSIADGRLRIRGSVIRLDVDVLDVVGISERERSRALVVSLPGRAETVLAGVSRRSVREILAAYGAQVAEGRRLLQLLSTASQQGASATQWWAAVRELMGGPRWVDGDSVAALQRARPVTDGWVAACAEPRLSERTAAFSADERAAVHGSRTVDLANWAQQRNEEFLEWEKRELTDFFHTVEKSPLTDQQTRATVCFDNRVRVIAAAGSGKTSTMVARAGYAIKRGIAQPTEVLALAFNKKAAGELSERMEARLGDDGAGVASSTFHAFGLRVIGEGTGRKPSLPEDLTTDDGVGRLAGVVDVLRDRDPGFRRNWDLFRLVFGRQLPDLGDENDPEKADPRTKALGFGTLAGEIVKSQEEVMIANWLFLNGVSYEYERPYAQDVADAHHRQYQPDFYYPDIDVWHEHWAIGPDGNPPAQFEGYAESMQWRRQTHTQFGTDLIETTSASIRDGSGFEHLERELRRRGVELDEDPYREAVGESPITDRAMVTLMRGFMKHAKGNRVAPEVLEQRASRSLRNRLFVGLYAPVLAEWDRQLQAARQIDFEDMLNLATDQIEAGRWTSPYRVVMVDEMQDTSAARAGLVRALAKTPGTYLYAVGDDWQAINRFAGSDLTVMTRFDDWFGPASTIWLDRTFRSPQSLCDVAGAFVMKNPGQIAKQVQSSAPDPGVTVAALSVPSANDYARALGEHLSDLDTQLDAPATVLLLGRYGANAEDASQVLRTRYQRLSIEFNTVHGSKGKEADYVVILGLERGGFPSTREDDPVLQLAMVAPDPHPHAEERRLFYVALTRARRSVLLLTRRQRESPFLIELVRDRAVAIRSIRGEDITPTVCPKCNKRGMEERTGPYSTFLGCTGYPLCDGKLQISARQRG